jgi:tetratricopeptide (TPR) repeat protein
VTWRSGLAVLATVATLAGGQDSDTLERARRLMKEGRAGAACEAYEAWLKDHPADRAVLREAATAAFRERRWFESARWLERLVALDPVEPSGWYDLGALRYNQCRFDLAVTVFRQLETLEATDLGLAARAEHRFLHGDSARRLEHFGEAIAELSVACARNPDKAEYRKALAQALLDGGRFEAAATEFSRATASDPVAENYYGLGAALAGAGRADEAIAALGEARRLNPGDGRVLLKLGTLFTRKQDLPRAEAALVEGRHVVPRNVEMLFALAQVQRLQGRLEEATETRARGLEIQKEADAATERGRVFHRRMVTAPTDVDAHVTWGLDLLQQGRFDDAQPVFQRLLSFDPMNRLGILNLATLLARKGDAAAALLELRKLLEADDGDEIANLQTARIKMQRDVASALEHLKKAAARNPESLAAHDLLAMAYKALGDEESAAKEEAIRARLAAVESRPESR